MTYETRLTKAKTFADIFDIVRDVVEEYLGVDQAGLMVGITDLGSHGRGFVGAFYSLDANMIIINKRPLHRLMQTKPSMYTHYLFHVMLHEYVHSIGSYDEIQTRMIVQEISAQFFGETHPVTEFSTNLDKYLPDLTYPDSGFQPPEDMNIEFVKGIDRKNTNYIN